MTQSIRAFIAIEIPQKIKEELLRVQDSLKKAEADVKWTSPKSIHVTLKFLGNISEEQVSDISAAIRNAINDFYSFAATPQKVFALPRTEHPRVICAGVYSEDDALKQLAEKIEKALAPLGFPEEERKFKAHLTLGRLKGDKRKRELVETIKNTVYYSEHTININTVKLFQSTLTPQGAIYTELAAFELP